VQVRRGDTLNGLAKQHLQAQGLTAKAMDIRQLTLAIAQKNALPNPDLIHAGQILKIPATVLAHQPRIESMTQRTTPMLPDGAMPPPAGHAWPASPAAKIAVVGDSIAVGIARSMLEQAGVTSLQAADRRSIKRSENRFAIEATGGHSSPQVLEQLGKNSDVKNAELAIISVGTNDIVNSTVNAYYTPERITRNLQRIRSELNAKDRVWVLPYDPKARELVQSVARENGDKVIDLAQFAAADRYHPKNYKAIASSISATMAPKPTHHLEMAQVEERPRGQADWPSTQNALLARQTGF
jgi:hypothetical protein